MAMQEKLAVRSRGISKTLREVVALDRLDLDIAERQVPGLAGPNRAAQSTAPGQRLGMGRDR